MNRSHPPVIHDNDLLWEKWTLVGGGVSRRVTHLPTGIAVFRDTTTAEPLSTILAEMRRELETRLAALPTNSPDANDRLSDGAEL
jgi:hypothetical protein